MGMRVKADTSSAFSHTPADEMEWFRKSVSVAPSLAFEGESLRLCLRSRSKRAWMFFRGSTGLNHDDIVQVCRNLFQTLDNIVDHLHKPTRQRAAALRHNQPLVEARGGAKCREWDCIIAGGYLV